MIEKLYAIQQYYGNGDCYAEELENEIENLNGVIVGGCSDWIDITSTAYLQYKHYFDDFLYEINEIENGNFENFGNVAEILKAYFSKTNGEDFTSDDVNAFIQLAHTDYKYEEEIITDFLTIINGNKYKCVNIYGDCQGDFAQVIIPENTTAEAIRYFSICYFSNGVEFALLFGDGNENITAENCNNFDFADEWIYYDYYNAEDFKKYLSKVYGVEIDNITVFTIENEYTIKKHIYGEN